MTKRKTNEEYIIELAKKMPDYEALEPYVNKYTKILHRHKTCGHEWKIKPDNILFGKGCPKCNGTRLKTHDAYVMKLAEKMPDYEVLETYINTRTKILHKHKTCGHEWKIRPNSILHGHSCPMCAKSGYNPCKSGSFYWFIVEHLDKKVIKFGITNNVYKRMTEHNFNLTEASVLKFDKHNFKYYEFDNGQHALELENSIKKNFELDSLPIEGFKTEVISYKKYKEFKAHVVKLVDTLALGASA